MNFEEVKTRFLSENSIAEGSNNYACGLLMIANEESHGNWSCEHLSREQILEIMLPPHRHKEEFILRTGLTVAAALEKMETSSYKSSNPDCWNIIDFHKQRPLLSSVFLSARPIDSEDYRYLVGWEGHLVHLDGLHRLLAWGLSGRFESEKVIAYVAGNL